MTLEMWEKMKSNIQLEHTEYIPKELCSGILYVSQRFQVAAHLCACGCKSKVVTPLGDCEWEFTEKNGKPTLSPSIGNWQIPCRSHYWITNGEIIWSYSWTEEQVEKGRLKEKEIRESYFNSKIQKKSVFKRIFEWVTNRIKQFRT